MNHPQSWTEKAGVEVGEFVNASPPLNAFRVADDLAKLRQWVRTTMDKFRCRRRMLAEVRPRYNGVGFVFSA
jgi:hypothetical protein